MRRTAITTMLLLLLSAILLLAIDQQAYAQQQPEIRRQLLLQQDSTIPGYELYMVIVEIPGGVSEVRHTHPGPLAGYVAEGELILEHEGRPRATYKTGTSFLVEAGKVHQGINMGSVTVKLIVTLVLEKGKPANSLAP